MSRSSWRRRRAAGLCRRMLWEEHEGRERQEGQPEGGEEQGQEERRERA